MGTDIDVLIIGGGQAGLAMVRALEDQGVGCAAYERHERIGDSWRLRFDSLVLFSARRCSALPGLPVPGDPNGFPTKDEIADYLEQYASRFALPVHTGDGIAKLSMIDGEFVALTQSGASVTARAVVVATGPFQRPRIPPFAAALAPSVKQFDVASYRNPRDVPGATVIVMGDGASGRQMARELAESHQVLLATGKRRHFVPQRFFGRDSTFLFYRIGLLTADKHSRIGRQVRARDAIPGMHLRDSSLRRARVTILPRVVDAHAGGLAFADGRVIMPDAVLWAGGYRDELGWLDIHGAVEGGTIVADRGVCPIPGLFVIGRDWQTCRASALLCGVDRDALTVAVAVRRLLWKDAGRGFQTSAGRWPSRGSTLSTAVPGRSR
jgi:putative flavoprotein involved in K+ transport